MVEEKDYNGHDAKETTKTGSDLPKADGMTSDESFNALTDDGGDKPIGQDHSLDNYEDSEPTSGVGTFGDNSEAHVEGE